MQKQICVSLSSLGDNILLGIVLYCIMWYALKYMYIL